MADVNSEQDDALGELAETLAASLDMEADDVGIAHGHLTVRIGINDLFQAIRTLRDDPKLLSSTSSTFAAWTIRPASGALTSSTTSCHRPRMRAPA
jgi:hypothetical protein